MYVCTCDLCKKPCQSYRFQDNKRVCFECVSPKNNGSFLVRKTVKSHTGADVTIARGDRFLWNTFKWYVVEFLEKDYDVVIRLDGTADVAIVPETLVGELIEKFSQVSTGANVYAGHQPHRLPRP